jgi:8-oxo-dGTP pyrophosphatase MutT (NUDIX family)
LYLDGTVLERLETKYGVPHEFRHEAEMSEREFRLCRHAMRRGRAHDVTLFIVRGEEIAVIRKWSYPPGLYRPPSGGVEPEEPFEVGAAREAFEETGLTVALDRYLVRARARFTHGEELIDWTTHLFGARYLEGEIRPVDEREIAEARWATLAELDTELRSALLATGSAGFRYRVALHDAALRGMGLRE